MGSGPSRQCGCSKDVSAAAQQGLPKTFGTERNHPALAVSLGHAGERLRLQEGWQGGRRWRFRAPCSAQDRFMARHMNMFTTKMLSAFP